MRVGAASGCNEHCVVRIRLAVRNDDVLFRNDFIDARLEMQLDILFLVPSKVTHDDLLFGYLFTQQRRQRNPIVERIRLVCKKCYRARWIVLAKLFCGRRTGKTVPDDYITPKIAY